MRKIKIELWLVYLFLILFFVFIIFFGALVRHEILAPKSRVPAISSVALFLAEIPSTVRDVSQGQNDDLRVKVDRFENVKGFNGNANENQMYLLLSKYDGDKEKSIVQLVDLTNFTIKKTWLPDIDYINSLVDPDLPQFKNLNRDKYAKRYSIRHPFLTEDGGLIFKDDSPLVKIDKNSKLVWQNQEELFHHSVEQDHEGNYWVPVQIFPYITDKKYIGSDFGYKEDGITKVSGNGEILYKKSLTNLFIENGLEYLIFPLTDFYSRDPLHLNDIQPVLTDGPYWKQGDVFLSFRALSMVILYRPSSNKIIWKGVGHFAGQHDVDILDNKRISIFNNNSYLFNNKRKVDGNSGVIIYNFETDSYSKYLDKPLKKFDVRTKNQGLSEIIDNGDLFVEEQNYGRLLYFNQDGSLKWQYVNRADNGNVYFLNWSRILYRPEDLKKVRKIIQIEEKNE